MTDKITIINQRNPWMWVMGIIALIAIFLIWKGCQVGRNSIARNTLLQSQLDSTTAVMNDMTGRFIADRKIQDARLLASNQETQTVKHQRDSTDKSLQATQTTLGRLATQLRYVREALPGEDSISVNPRYIIYCDSLGDLQPVLKAQIDGLRTDNDKLGELMQFEVDLRQQAIKDERHNTDSALGMASLFRTLATQAVKDATPRRRVYLTGSLQWTPLGTTGGGGLTLANKKSTMFTVQAIYGRGWGISAQVSQLLSLRKRR